jgi:hypothetical protein
MDPSPSLLDTGFFVIPPIQSIADRDRPMAIVRYYCGRNALRGASSGSASLFAVTNPLSSISEERLLRAPSRRVDHQSPPKNDTSATTATSSLRGAASSFAPLSIEERLLQAHFSREHSCSLLSPKKTETTVSSDIPLHSERTES